MRLGRVELLLPWNAPKSPDYTDVNTENFSTQLFQEAHSLKLKFYWMEMRNFSFSSNVLLTIPYYTRMREMIPIGSPVRKRLSYEIMSVLWN
jgi:hypothetical protein